VLLFAAVLLSLYDVLLFAAVFSERVCVRVCVRVLVPAPVPQRIHVPSMRACGCVCVLFVVCCVLCAVCGVCCVMCAVYCMQLCNSPDAVEGCMNSSTPHRSQHAHSAAQHSTLQHCALCAVCWTVCSVLCAV
jgi:hypothetical protein